MATSRREVRREGKYEMTSCTFCGADTTTGSTAHWRCGGILPDDPRQAAVSAADHIVRLLTPKRVQREDGRTFRKPPEALSPAQLRAKLRPELYEHFDDGSGPGAGGRCDPPRAQRLPAGTDITPQARQAEGRRHRAGAVRSARRHRAETPA